MRKQGFEGAGTGRGSLPTYQPSPEEDGGEEAQATGCRAVLRKSWPGRWGLPRLNFPIRRVPIIGWEPCGTEDPCCTPAVPLPCSCRAQSLPRGGQGGAWPPVPWEGGGVAVEAVSLLCFLPLALLSPSEPHPGEGGTRGFNWQHPQVKMEPSLNPPRSRGQDGIRQATALLREMP